jgi:predicted aspartyl protease
MAKSNLTFSSHRHTKLLTCFVVLFGIVVFIFVRWQASLQPRTSLALKQREVLHSKLQDGAVYIPFKLKNNCIYTKAVVGDRTVDCMVDTGADWILWPSSLGLKGRRTGEQTVINAINDMHGIANIVIIPSIRLGDYEILNARTFSSVLPNMRSTSHSSPSKQMDFPWSFTGVGNEVFRDRVLTIDYEKQMIVLREKTYDITKKRLRPTDRLLNFTWAKTAGDQIGRPVVEGKMEGRSIHIMLDTCVGGVAISTDLYRSIGGNRKLVKTQFSTHLGPTKGNNVNKMIGSIAGIMFGGEFGVCDFNVPLEAAVGGAFLKHFRVTFDYARNKVLLETATKY